MSLDSISGNTPLQTSDSDSELDEFLSPPLYLSLVQLSLSVSLSVSTGSSSDYKKIKNKNHAVIQKHQQNTWR